MSGDDKPRLLVVDDEVEFVNFVCEFADVYGFAVATASNGQIAQQRFHEFNPNIILLDVVMPQVDGIEFIEWLGNQGADVRLIVVTGYNPYYGQLAEKLGKSVV